MAARASPVSTSTRPRSAVSCEDRNTSSACCSGESSSPKEAWMPPCAFDELFACREPLVARATRAPAASADKAAASPEAPLPITSTSKVCAACVTRLTIPEISAAYSLFTGSVDNGGAVGRLAVRLRQPLEPAREVPVPAPEDLHRRGEEHRAHDRRVDGDRDRED